MIDHLSDILEQHPALVGKVALCLIIIGWGALCLGGGLLWLGGASLLCGLIGLPVAIAYESENV